MGSKDEEIAGAPPRIPTIIHQTWKDDRVPPTLAEYSSSWRAHHPAWEHRLWTDAMNRAFIAAHYPEFLAQYDRYPEPIQRADAIRYFLLYHYGGLYVDLDFRCLRPFDPLLEGKSCVLGQEAKENCALFKRTRIVCNALMAATPRHPFFRAVIDALPEYAARGASAADPVLETTGPFMLTGVYEAFPEPASVELLPSELLYPLSTAQADEYRRTGRSPVSLADSYAVHLHLGTWWRADTLAREGVLRPWWRRSLSAIADRLVPARRRRRA